MSMRAHAHVHAACVPVQTALQGSQGEFDMSDLGVVDHIDEVLGKFLNYPRALDLSERKVATPRVW